MKRLILTVGLCLLSAPSYALTVFTYDFIADASRTNFNSFEQIPNDGTYYTGGNTYTQDGITVQQVNGTPGNDIWVTYFSPDGNYGWYPNGGDFGYTALTLADSSDFADVGFLYSTGFNTSTTLYALYNNGNLVLSGSVSGTSAYSASYLGFSGGGFDEIRLWDTNPCCPDNAFAIDSIEVANGVPDSASTISLLGLSLSLVGVARRFTRSRTSFRS